MKKRNYGYRLATKELRAGPYDKWQLYRERGKEHLSLQGQLKLEWIIFYNTIGDKKVTFTAKHFGISRKTLHKWLKRFTERNLFSLEEITRKPHQTRSWGVTQEEEKRITTLRRTYLKLGKRKLKVLYQDLFGERISTWKIERVVRRYSLYPNKVEYQKYLRKRQDTRSKLRIHSLKEAIQDVHEFGFLWHMDSIILWWNGRRVCILTALEEHTRIAYARIYSNNTTSTTEDFLKRLMYVSENKVRIMHSDNGSEFQGSFEKMCKTLGILQIYSRVRTPKDNALLERFNRTIQEEWLSQCEQGLDDIALANHALTDWLIFYNSQRPHQALDYKTPLKYAEDTFFNLLPMYPASTRS